MHPDNSVHGGECWRHIFLPCPCREAHGVGSDGACDKVDAVILMRQHVCSMPHCRLVDPRRFASASTARTHRLVASRMGSSSVRATASACRWSARSRRARRRTTTRSCAVSAPSTSLEARSVCSLPHSRNDVCCFFYCSRLSLCIRMCLYNTIRTVVLFPRLGSVLMQFWMCVVYRVKINSLNCYSFPRM